METEIECYMGSPAKGKATLAQPTRWRVKVSRSGEATWGATFWNCGIWDVIHYVALKVGSE